MKYSKFCSFIDTGVPKEVGLYAQCKTIRADGGLTESTKSKEENQNV